MPDHWMEIHPKWHWNHANLSKTYPFSGHHRSGKFFSQKYGYYGSLDKILIFLMFPNWIPLNRFIFSQIYHLWTRLQFSPHISNLFSVHGQNRKQKVSLLHGSFYTVSDKSKMPIFSRKSSQIDLNLKCQHFLLKFKATESLHKIRILTVVTFLNSCYMEKSRGVPREQRSRWTQNCGEK